MHQLRLSVRHDPEGYLPGVFLLEDEGTLAVVEDDGRGNASALPLPAVAVSGVFDRYGKPLEEGLVAPALQPDDSFVDVPLASGVVGRVRSFSFMGWGSVMPTAYLLWEREGHEPLAAPADLLSAALLALARAVARSTKG